MPSRYLEVFRSRRLAIILLLGFSSGLPLALTGGTLQAWMTVEGVDLSTIGVFTLVGLPYVWKFLWAPAMDRFVPPFLGRRRGWLLVTQVALAVGIAGMAFLSPRTGLVAIAWLALLVAFASASQDIVVDAYRTDVVSREERGLAGALGVVGYRLAMLASGALALVLVAGSGWIPALGWRDLLMAALMAVGVLAVLWGEEPSTAPAAPRTLRDAVIEPLREFFSRPKAGWILVLLVLYKFGDAFAGSLTTAFLLRGAGFSLEDVGYVNKAVGLAATIVGVLFGGALMVRLGLYRALLGFGILQAVSILAFMWLALVGKSYPIMVFAVGFENIAWGMGTAAFVALLMALCDHRFTATQYALLSALASFGRVYVGPVAGYATDPKYLGLSWATFFLLAFGTALPGLVLVWLLRKEIERAEAAATS
ncbi:MAG: MFS transporter [Betaproteobacteria bacterium]|nr:MAG: MFS transporter [Betaproteobacteria bacterium]